MPTSKGKYEALKTYLLAQAASVLPMTFSEIERVIGARLPRSAKLYRTWWSNDALHHVQASAWLDAGFRTEQVDLNSKSPKLVFVRDSALHGVGESGKEYEPGEKRTGEHPLIGSMKGTFTIEPGWDLTKPALDPEELAEMEANLDRTADMIERGLSGKSR